MSIFEDLWQQEIDALKAKSLLRSHRLLSSPQQIEPLVDGRKLLSFCSNDYLGLANHTVSTGVVWAVAPRILSLGIIKNMKP